MISLSEKLHLFCNMVSCAQEIIFTRFNTAYEIESCSYPNPDAISLFFSMDMINHLEEMPAVALSFYGSEFNYKTSPQICTNSLGMVWITEPIITKDRNLGLITLGPVFPSDYSMQNVSKSMDRLQIPFKMKREFMQFTEALPIISMTTMSQYGLMLHYCLYEEKIGISDIIYVNTAADKKMVLDDASFSAPEKLRSVTSLLLQAVAAGNKKYTSLWKEYLSLTEAQPFSGPHALRDAKNNAIILTAQCCFAAMDGGLSPSVAFLLKNNYTESIEEATGIPSINEISNTMLKDYLLRVHKGKTEPNVSPQIRCVCEQIDIAPAENYDLKTLAESLGYSEYYFSKKFHQETGITFKDYLLLRRINYAEQLLKDSNLSIQAIADILQFGSQSYFAKSFKKITGLSPSAYRQKGGAAAPPVT